MSAVSHLAVFTGLASWNNFFGPRLFRTSREKFTLPLFSGMMEGFLGTRNRSYVLAAIMPSITRLLLLFLVVQRQIMSRVVLTGMKG